MLLKPPNQRLHVGLGIRADLSYESPDGRSVFVTDDGKGKIIQDLFARAV